MFEHYSVPLCQKCLLLVILFNYAVLVSLPTYNCGCPQYYFNAAYHDVKFIEFKHADVQPTYMICPTQRSYKTTCKVRIINHA